MTPKLPSGWIESTLVKWPYTGVFAVCWYRHRLIEYWGAWWLAFFQWALRRHERGHAWGIEKCLSNSKFCVMAEDDDTWRGKLSTLPTQIIGLGTYCAGCKEYLKAKGGL